MYPLVSHAAECEAEALQHVTMEFMEHTNKLRGVFSGTQRNPSDAEAVVMLVRKMRRRLPLTTAVLAVRDVMIQLRSVHRRFAVICVVLVANCCSKH